jgi:hypothetical protein
VLFCRLPASGAWTTHRVYNGEPKDSTILYKKYKLLFSTFKKIGTVLSRFTPAFRHGVMKFILSLFIIDLFC